MVWLHDALRTLLLQGEPGVVISGAGLSVASGLPTFRGNGGLYVNEPPPFLDYNYFLAHPDESWDGFLQLHDDLSTGVVANAAHYALAELQHMGFIAAIITQNIDGFHQAAGSEQVIELHGSYKRVRCTVCRATSAMHSYEALKDPRVRRCSRCGGLCKPDVILFNEQIEEQVIALCLDHLRHSGFLVLVGTSAQVYPARHFMELARQMGKFVINVNLENSDGLADLDLLGACEVILPQLCEELKRVE